MNNFLWFVGNGSEEVASGNHQNIMWISMSLQTLYFWLITDKWLEKLIFTFLSPMITQMWRLKVIKKTGILFKNNIIFFLILQTIHIHCRQLEVIKA